MPPGRSLTCVVNLQSRPSTTKPCSITRSRIVRSMLPPHSSRTTFFPTSSAPASPMIAASAAAPAPSTTVFSSSNNRSTANDNASSPTVTTRSISGAASANDNSPTFPTASPSASVGRIGTDTGLPASSAALRLAAEAVSTAMICTLGLRLLATIATPASRPAPPVGTTRASTSGTSARISNAIVPCPAITRASSKP